MADMTQFPDWAAELIAAFEANGQEWASPEADIDGTPAVTIDSDAGEIRIRFWYAYGDADWLYATVGRDEETIAYGDVNTLADRVTAYIAAVEQ